jgi:hypothetical protein
MQPRDSAVPPSGAPTPEGNVWTRRLFLVIEVLFFVELGVMLVVLPWTHIWTENPLLTKSYVLHQLAQSGFVRGIVSGLGLIDLWIAIADAVNYRE